MKAILVCHQVPRPTGHGGNRRAYQIRRDLENALGAAEVVVTDDLWNYHTGWTWRRFPYHAWRVASPFLENPLKLASRTRFSRRLYSFPRFHSYYESLLREVHGPAVSIIEHAGFSSLLPINARHGIPTIACTQNLEAFDMSDDLQGRWATRAKAIDFANEVDVLARCEQRLFISKVEAGIMGGLGLPGHFYPYLPVGQIRERLDGVRQARAKGAVEPGLFLMLGTVGPAIRRASFQWVLDNARTRGLPDHVRLVVAGLFTETLLRPGETPSGIEVRGWLGENDLDTLLTRVAAVLVPQRQGFGALTRVPELSCAGVPALASRSATFAQDPPPGVEIVDDDWDAWCDAMESCSRRGSQVLASDYAAWESGQPRPLAEVVKAVAPVR